MGGGLRERLLLDLDRAYLHEFADPGVHELQDGFLAGLDILDELVLAFEIPVNQVVVELHEGYQLAVAFDHERLRDAVHAVDYVLDLLGIDVLARSSDYQASEASAHEIASLAVAAGQVTGAEPAVVAEHRHCPFVVLVVAEHHIGTLDRDFSLPGLGIDVGELDLYSGDRLSGRAYCGLAWRRGADQRGGLGESVAYGVGEARLLEEGLHRGVELRAADSEELEASSEGLAQFDSYERVEQPAHMFLQELQELAAVDGGYDAALVDFLDDQGHRQHGRGPYLLQRGEQDAGGRDLLQIGHPCSHCEGVEHADAELVGVGHGQYGEEHVLLADAEAVPGAHHVHAEVPVAEHHSLGVAGGAGGVEYGRDVQRGGHADLAVAGVGFAGGLHEGEVVDVYHQVQPFDSLLAELCELLLRDEYGLGLRMRQDVLHLVVREVGEHGHGDAAECGDREEGDAPVGLVLRKYRHLVGRAYSEVGQDSGNVVTTVLELGVAVAHRAVGVLRSCPAGVSRTCVVVKVSKGTEVRFHLVVLLVWLQ